MDGREIHQHPHSPGCSPVSVRTDRRRRVVDHHHQEAPGVGELRAASTTTATSRRPSADSGITNLAGMEGKIVGVDTGSTGDMWTTAHQAETKIGSINKYEGSAAGHARPAGRAHRRLHLRHPALLYYSRTSAVQSGRAHQDHRAIFGDVHGRAAGGQGQRRHHRIEEGRHARQDPRDLVRHQPDDGLATSTVMDMPKL